MGFLRRAGEFVGITSATAPPSDLRAMSPGVAPPRRPPVDSVTLDTSLTLPSVYRSIQILAAAVAQLGIRVERGGEVMERTPSLVTQPDVDQTLSQFLKRTVIGLAGTGNAYWLIIRNSATGAISGLQVLDPLGVQITRDRKGNKVYLYGDKEYAAKQIKHLRLLEVPGHDEGLGPIQACRQGVQGALTLRSYSDQWFNNSGVPTGVLSTDAHLTPEEHDAYRERWHELQRDRDIAVLGRGLSYEPIILKPSDAQFLESQEFSVTDTARMFGIPASYLLAEVNGSNLVYTNSRDVDYQFAKYTLSAYLTEIEDAFTSLLVRGQVAKFELDAFLKPDPKAQAEIFKAYKDMGVLSADEIRQELGYTGPAPKPPKPIVQAPPAPAAAPDPGAAAPPPEGSSE